ncbi:MAG TPA: hypothetical protein VLG12_01945 [Candidatus Saccharimonadales bacterium]|nr:hypothetical protein [Candidatus Saccharimonadales bacterium]
MKKAFKTIVQDRIILWGFVISLLLLIAVAIYIVVVYPQLPPILPIYNRLSWGYSRLGVKAEIFIPFGLAVVFCTINLFIAAAVYNKVVLISRMIGAISFTLALCTSIYILKIMQLIL